MNIICVVFMYLHPIYNILPTFEKAICTRLKVNIRNILFMPKTDSSGQEGLNAMNLSQVKRVLNEHEKKGFLLTKT